MGPNGFQSSGETEEDSNSNRAILSPAPPSSGCILGRRTKEKATNDAKATVATEVVKPMPFVTLSGTVNEGESFFSRTVQIFLMPKATPAISHSERLKYRQTKAMTTARNLASTSKA